MQENQQNTSTPFSALSTPPLVKRGGGGELMNGDATHPITYEIQKGKEKRSSSALKTPKLI